MTNIIDELKWRGAVNQVSDEENLSKLLDEKSVGVYCGTDPTGDSLHVGHLIPFMMLTVGIGEILAIGVLGNLLRAMLERYSGVIFKKNLI